MSVIVLPTCLSSLVIFRGIHDTNAELVAEKKEENGLEELKVIFYAITMNSHSPFKFIADVLESINLICIPT